MKKKIALFYLVCVSGLIHAQNVGIGTTNPLGRLHVFTGASGNTGPFSPMVVETNNNTYINLLSPNINETAILFGKQNDAASGGIIYNNVDNLNGLQFRTNGNVTRMVLGSNGYLGIGTLSPTAPLSFTSSLGKKISLYSSSLGDAGFGISSSRLQIYADNPNSDVAIGFDNAGVFNERFAIKPSGALALNQNTGNSLNIPVSSGSGGATNWQPLGNVLKSNYIYTNNTLGSYEQFVSTPGEVKIASISGLTFTVDVPSRFIVSASMYTTTSCPGIGSCALNIDFYYKVNGIPSNALCFGGDGYFTATLSNHFYDVSPGTHTIDFYSRKQYSSSLNYHSAGGHVTVMVLPK